MHKAKLFAISLWTVFTGCTGMRVNEPKASFLAPVYDFASRKVGYINEKSDVVIPFKYQWGFNFSNNRALVVLDDGTAALINPKGEQVWTFPSEIVGHILPPTANKDLHKLEELRIELRDSVLTLVDFSKQATFIQSNRYFYHLRKGKLNQFKYDEAGNFSEGKAYAARKGKGKYIFVGYINEDGSEIFELKLNFPLCVKGFNGLEYHNGIALIRQLNDCEEQITTWWELDSTGKLSERKDGVGDPYLSDGDGVEPYYYVRKISKDIKILTDPIMVSPKPINNQYMYRCISNKDHILFSSINQKKQIINENWVAVGFFRQIVP